MPLERSASVLSHVDSARASGSVLVSRLEEPDVHYLAAIPLTDGRVVSAVVPPIREISAESPLGPFLGIFAAEAESPLSLVPLLESDHQTHPDTVGWISTDTGWRAETVFVVPGERYNVHYDLDLASHFVLSARATLLLLLNLVVLLTLACEAAAVTDPETLADRCRIMGPGGKLGSVASRWVGRG